ncbi:MAG: carbohydrate ABC transporter permease [Planctomycetota bacterium]|nr:carbohydrate ABC transporter permease [Planctomycetota bacterium]
MTRKLLRALVFVSLAFWFLLVVVPVVWLVYSSFKTNEAIFADPWRPPLSPAEVSVDNYARAWSKSHVGGYFLNSVVTVSSALFGTLLLSAMAAYGLARLRVKGRRVIYYLFVAGMIVPTALTLAPLFELLRSLSLLNSLTGLALVYVAFSIPFSLLMLYGFFSSLPEEVREAAIVDGATEWQTFWHVFLPMARPGLVTVAIFNFLGLWNEYLLALVTLIEPEKQTLQLGIANMVVSMNYRSDWGTLLATMVLAMLPVLVLYAALHKRVVEGMILGAVKG